MASEWRTMPFGEVTRNFDTQRVPVKEADRVHGRYPYYGASGIIDHVDRYIFDGDYLLVAEDGANLLTRNTPVAFMASGKFWVNNHAHIVQGNANALTRFLCYWFSANDISGYVTGSAQPKLTQDALNRIPVEVPPIATQREIVRVLGALDDKIELNRRMNQTLEELARAVFEKWLSENEDQIVTERVQTLTDRGVLVVGDGYRAKRSELAETGLPFARAGNLDGGFNFTGAEYLGSAGVAAAREKVSRDYDAVFTSKGTVGRIAQVLPNTPRFIYAPQLCYWRVLKSELLSPDVLFQWMHGSEFREQIDALKGQTDMADYVSLGDQREMEITLPFSADSRTVSERLRVLALRLDANLAQTRILAALRDSLLPRLLSGELRLRDAERIAETAT